MNRTGATAPSLDDIREIAGAAFASLPQVFLALCGNVPILVDDWPSDEILDEFEAESPYDIMGLFQGVALTAQSVSDIVSEPNLVFLYRQPILAYWAAHDETLGAIVRHVLIHEIGHHFGLSDADMEAIEAEAGEAEVGEPEVGRGEVSEGR